jgi:hypothetical protein
MELVQLAKRRLAQALGTRPGVPGDDRFTPSNKNVPAANAETEAAAEELACSAVRTADCARDYYFTPPALNLNSEIERSSSSSET